MEVTIKKLIITIFVLITIVTLFFMLSFISLWWPDIGDRKELIKNGSCDLPIVWYVRLSDNEKCLLKSIKNRCNKIDKCFSECLTGGRGYNIGGGCFHTCDYAGKSGWIPPEKDKTCYSDK